MNHVPRRWAHPVFPIVTRLPSCTGPYPAFHAHAGAAARIPRCRPLSTSKSVRDDGYDNKTQGPSLKGLDGHEQDDRVRPHQPPPPWLRENVDSAADRQPASRDGSSSRPPEKGKLLTTPTRLLKLILPLPMRVEKNEKGSSGNDYGRALSSNDVIQPFALLVHPQQPLSYVERLIQAEVPAVVEGGKEKVATIYFHAEDTTAIDNEPVSRSEARKRDSSKQRSISGDEGSPHNVASYSGLGREGPERKQKEMNWVRWSSSTEMGDFIRDAARGREFSIEIEGYGVEMRVNVPSFNDRTYYMRTRLRRMSREMEHLFQIKNECDLIAHRSAYRLAKGGFGLLASWWGIVYYVSFHTEFGWDLVEPITYLAGLGTIMGGYLWFLYISRDLSYKAAMKVTVSRRQHALYEAKGFDPNRWERLVGEANSLRREIRTAATEYDVDWDESTDMSEDVVEVLDKGKNKSEERRRDREGSDEPEEVKTDKKQEATVADER